MSLSPVPWASNCSWVLPPAQIMLTSTKYIVVRYTGTSNHVAGCNSMTTQCLSPGVCHLVSWYPGHVHHTGVDLVLGNNWLSASNEASIVIHEDDGRVIRVSIAVSPELIRAGVEEDPASSLGLARCPGSGGEAAECCAEGWPGLRSQGCWVVFNKFINVYYKITFLTWCGQK